MTEEINENENGNENEQGELGEFLGQAFDFDSLKLGVQQSSYLVGFAYGLKTLDLADEIVGNILLNKLVLEYQQEMKRMELQTRENIAEKMMSYEEIENEY
jgi:hypothetical protein